MIGYVSRFLPLVGLGLVAIGTYRAIVAPSAERTSAAIGYVFAAVALLALVFAIVRVVGTLDSDSESPAVPWAPGEVFAEPAPERTETEYPLSSDGLASVLRRASSLARESGSVEIGIREVRPPLREAVLDSLAASGRSRQEVRDALADGTWTDDRVAASVLDDSVSPPDRSVRERAIEWLFPGRVVRRRTRRAMQEVAETADEALPTIPGQTAPRTVPVIQPRLEDLQRGADGALQQAVDPLVVSRGPRPPEPDVDRSPPGEEASDRE